MYYQKSECTLNTGTQLIFVFCSVHQYTSTVGNSRNNEYRDNLNDTLYGRMAANIEQSFIIIIIIV